MEKMKINIGGVEHYTDAGVKIEGKFEDGDRIVEAIKLENGSISILTQRMIDGEPFQQHLMLSLTAFKMLLCASLALAEEIGANENFEKPPVEIAVLHLGYENDEE